MPVGTQVKPSSSVPLKPALLGRHKDLVGTAGLAKPELLGHHKDLVGTAGLAKPELLGRHKDLVGTAGLAKPELLGRHKDLVGTAGLAKPELLGHHKDLVGTAGLAKLSMSETKAGAARQTAIGDGLVHNVGDSTEVTDDFVQSSPSGSPKTQEAAVCLSPVANNTCRSPSPLTSPHGVVPSDSSSKRPATAAAVALTGQNGQDSSPRFSYYGSAHTTQVDVAVESLFTLLSFSYISTLSYVN